MDKFVQVLCEKLFICNADIKLTEIESNFNLPLFKLSSWLFSSCSNVGSILKVSPSIDIHENHSIPLILLDVDGVINSLNAVRIKTSLDSNDGKYSKVHINDNKISHHIRWMPNIVDAINSWSNTKLAEIKWLTTWDDNAQTLLAPALKLNHFELARDPKLMLSKENAAKLNASYDEDRPLIWIDDDLSCFGLDREFWSSRKAMLFVNTRGSYELTNDDVLKIEEFLKNPVGNNFNEAVPAI